MNGSTPQRMSREQLFPLLMIWALVLLLLADVALDQLSVDEATAWTFLAPMGTAVGTAAVYVRWIWLLARGVPASERRWPLALIVAGSALSLGVDHEWATLGMAFAALMSGLPRRLAPPAVALAVVAVMAFLTSVSSFGVALAAALLNLGLGLVLFAFTRLSLVIHSLLLAREELARSRVDEDRLRIQRDLHDMLGRTLVSASLRNQVALRTLGKSEEKTREHLQLLHTVISEGQARLRALTSGPVVASLPDELDSAQDLCARIGVICTVRATELPAGASGGFAALVVREGITNLLKHSHATTCTITVARRGGSTEVVVENDGSGRTDAEVVTTGTGLNHLRAQAQRLGGSVTTHHVGRGGFRLVATIPDGQPVAAQTPGDAASPAPCESARPADHPESWRGTTCQAS